MLGRLVNERPKNAPPAYPWGDSLPVLARADLRAANLEFVLAAGGEPEAGKVFHFRSDPKNVASLRSAGIDLVSLANNHVLDFGTDAFRQMPPALDAAGILHASAGVDRDDARRPAVRRAAGSAVGLISFTDHQPGREADRGRLLRPGGGRGPPGRGAPGSGPADEGTHRTVGRVRALGAEPGFGGAGLAPAAGARPDRGRGRRRLRALAAHLPRRRGLSEPPHHLQPGTSWTTTPWTRWNLTISRSSSCWTPTPRSTACCGCTRRSSTISRSVWRAGTPGKSPCGCTG
ncbi:hypothetical protein ABIB51_001024 [Arthrobacter sp. UYCu712]